MEGITLKLSGYILLSLILSFSFPAIQIANAKGPSTSGAVILKQTSGARALGMGEAFVALADDVNCLYWNPAGLTQIRNHEVSMMYLDGLVDSWFGFVVYAYPLGAKGRKRRRKITRVRKVSKPQKYYGTIALGVTVFQAGKITLDPEGKTVVAEQDYLVTLGYGYPLWRRTVKRRRGLRFEEREQSIISLGLSVKIISSTLVEDYSAMAYAGDFGVLGKFLLGSNSLGVGVAVQNIGTKLKFEEEGDPLPLTIRAGSAYFMSFGKEHSLAVAVEAVKPNDNGFRGNVGVEYWYKEIFALRSGYKIGYDLDGFTAGVGFNWKGYGLDYGWGMMATKMGDNHRVSFTARF